MVQDCCLSGNSGNIRKLKNGPNPDNQPMQKWAMSGNSEIRSSLLKQSFVTLFHYDCTMIHQSIKDTLQAILVVKRSPHAKEYDDIVRQLRIVDACTHRGDVGL